MAIEHGLKQIGVPDPPLSSEGLEQLELYSKGEMGAWLATREIRLILIGRGRRFFETYLVLKPLFGGAPVQDFIVLGSEDSRIDFSVDEYLRSDIKVSYKETLITTKAGVIPLEESLRLDDPRLGKAAWAYPTAFEENFLSPILCICSKEFLRALGSRVTGSGDLFKLDIANQKVKRIFHKGEYVGPK